MPIAFSNARWEKIREDARKWWAGELGRPLVQAVLHGRDSGRAEPGIPTRHFTAQYDLSISPEQIVDRWDYGLSCNEYLGDAFPQVWPNFGPGVAAGFMGAELEIAHNTVWFVPEEQQEIADIRFQYDPDNLWLNRVKALCRAATERWEGLVQVGMTDLGGNLDILSTFRPSEKLLLDLYDAPEEVKRLTWDAHELWWRYYDEISDVLQPVNPGYTAWTPIYSESPYYMLQCDFCYMISPEMFDEFVKPELAACCKRLGNAFYHLDGPGELPHLDSLLEIEELAGIQWVPGDGNVPQADWPEVHRRVRDAGKLIQLWGGPADLDKVAGDLGNAEGIVMLTGGGLSQRSEMEDFLEKYGAR